MKRMVLGSVLSLIGAVVGAAVGVGVFIWLKNQGYYGLVIPGAALGLGCNLASLDRSYRRGAICGIAGLVVGLVTEWKFFPFKDDDSLAYFLKHIPSLTPVTLLMIGAGGLFAFWWGRDAAPWLAGKGRRKVEA